VDLPSLQTLWAEVGFKPNNAQRQAILHIDGPLYLPAGPGSGKTRVLLWRTLNLIVYHGIPPAGIFLATFTEKAALQLKEGLRTLLGHVTNLTNVNYDLGEMYLGTVHSLCHRLVGDRNRRLDRQRVRPPRLLDDLDEYFFLTDLRTWHDLCSRVTLPPEEVIHLLNTTFDSASSSRHRAAQNLLSFCNRLAEECIDPAQARDRIAEDPTIPEFYQNHKIEPYHVDILLDLAAAYRAILAEQQVTTFSLIQQHAFDTLPDLQPATFRHIIIDEYQDTNPIQERIFLKLAATHANLCVVGDDDQALYRFRGATVENFVQFPTRCAAEFGRQPVTIPLVTNYRSREPIVTFYSDFIERCNWQRADGSGHYRVAEKRIVPHRQDTQPAVVVTGPAAPDHNCDAIADHVVKLLNTGVVTDPNQVAFLFPGLKGRDGDMTKPVARMRDALEERGLRVYAPRAGRFLNTPEAMDVFGIFAVLFGAHANPDEAFGTYRDYQNWLSAIQQRGRDLIAHDPLLNKWVTGHQHAMNTALADFAALRTVMEQRGWNDDQPYHVPTMKAHLLRAPALSIRAARSLNSAYFETQVRRRWNTPEAYPLRYVLNRVTAMDWSILDLFYQITGFQHFRSMFDLAEQGIDEGPICNLGLVTQYLNRFTNSYITTPTAYYLHEDRFANRLFGSFLYSLFRLGESEFENPDDPFPRGRIPFLTVHQSKGLEFPVVVIANPRKDIRDPSLIERMVRPILARDPGEPLDRMSEFDAMRLFYVAFSRAQNLLVFAYNSGRGQRIHSPLRALLENGTPNLSTLDLATVPPAQPDADRLARPYSYTADYLAYLRCARQYMVFRKYGLTPSQTQTMFFGSLIHRTLEDLHHHLIRQRETTP
jgi:DNA helicase-2/ATP-dependent DNA helicase PcrA